MSLVRKKKEFSVLNDEVVNILKKEGVADKYVLDGSGRKIQKIGEITGLPQLKSLDLSFNEIEVISGLNQLNQLKELRLYSNKIQELDGLDEMPHLEVLLLNHNNINSISRGLTSLRSLKVLHLDKNNISKIENLGTLQQLEVLDLSRNKIVQMNPIGGSKFSKLVEWKLNDNLITEIPVKPRLGGLDGLKELQLNNNKITSCKGLNAFTHLSILKLNNNRIRSLSAFPGMPNLTELYLSHNRLKTLKGVMKKFPALDVLDVSHNRIQDMDELTVLGSLEGLKEVFVAGNPVMETATASQMLQALLHNVETFDGEIVRGSILERMLDEQRAKGLSVTNFFRVCQSSFFVFSTFNMHTYVIHFVFYNQFSFVLEVDW
eukprot:TRINITY_DN11696_c0_g1_i7.p1 TRINITY_DN11696_c0_g1~~TRINITY_DN11696_c0_g1_i7.p1  ORF type:complete len:376 (-),score=75.57 TRINITY_DN11696_c0_g1_i7:10-1137(-)